MVDPLYYADGAAVFKSPVRHERPDGFTDVTMGFKVCEAGPDVEAKDIAKALNFADAAETLLRAGIGSLDDTPIFMVEVARLLKEFA